MKTELQIKIDNLLKEICEKQNETIDTLTTMDLHNKNLGNEGAQYLAQTLKWNETIISLDLSQNNISDLGFLNDFFLTKKPTRSLNLVNNKIQSLGFEMLCNILEKNEIPLNRLYLYSNQISNNGTELLSESLIKNKTLLLLNVGQNNIGDEGASYISKLLNKNSTMLDSLVLSGNNIGEKGLAAISKSLKTNTRLTSISLPFPICQTESKKTIEQKKIISTKITSNKTLAEKLLLAIQEKDLSEIKSLIKKGATLNYQDEHGKTPLHYAENPLIATLLLAQKNVLLLPDNEGNYPKLPVSYGSKLFSLLPSRRDSKKDNSLTFFTFETVDESPPKTPVEKIEKFFLDLENEITSPNKKRKL